jgi:hypothetical protein
MKFQFSIADTMIFIALLSASIALCNIPDSAGGPSIPFGILGS